jgi:prevent-host-death family protein
MMEGLDRERSIVASGPSRTAGGTSAPRSEAAQREIAPQASATRSRFATLVREMTVIPQRELRNWISALLRRAEQGEHFTVTVGGRPVAELGPLATARTPAAADRLAAVLGETPVDRGWARELRDLRDADAAVTGDPWAR